MKLYAVTIQNLDGTTTVDSIFKSDKKAANRYNQFDEEVRKTFIFIQEIEVDLEETDGE